MADEVYDRLYFPKQPAGPKDRVFAPSILKKATREDPVVRAVSLKNL